MMHLSLAHDVIASMSTDGKSIVVPNSGHFIQRDQGEILVAGYSRRRATHRYQPPWSAVWRCCAEWCAMMRLPPNWPAAATTA